MKALNVFLLFFWPMFLLIGFIIYNVIRSRAEGLPVFWVVKALFITLFVLLVSLVTNDFSIPYAISYVAACIVLSLQLCQRFYPGKRLMTLLAIIAGIVIGVAIPMAIAIKIALMSTN